MNHGQHLIARNQDRVSVRDDQPAEGVELICRGNHDRTVQPIVEAKKWRWPVHAARYV